jgi:hypothetical protein
MYKKSADLIHLNERTGSHATKGRGRGTVPQMVVPDPDAFDGREMRMKKRLLEHQLYIAIGEYRASITIHNSAIERKDSEVARAVRPTMRAFERNIKKMKIEIAKIKEVLKDHPAPMQLRKLRNLLTK